MAIPVQSPIKVCKYPIKKKENRAPKGVAKLKTAMCLRISARGRGMDNKDVDSAKAVGAMNAFCE